MLQTTWKDDNTGINKNCYTYIRRPLALVYKTNFINAEEAIKWEKKNQRLE